ncbi:hypothetical protein GW918_00235, partial [Candidatus Berkelbacteria bacterium]|nr:hypothetical protein [Candidatus Berkelbacteria bacterium]
MIIANGGGNVGIGTTAPQKLLTIASANPIIGLKDTDDNEGWALYDAGDYFSIYEYTNSDWTTGAVRLAIKQAGNVGIGTTSPYGKLDTIGAVTASANYGLLNIGPASTAFN